MTDAELCEQVKAGGDTADQAYSELLRRHRPQLMKATVGYFAPGEEHEDLMQAARLGLWEAALTWDQRMPFYAWVGFVARRKVITLVKFATRDKHRALRGYDELAIAAHDHEYRPSHDTPFEPIVAEFAEPAGLTDLEAHCLAGWLDGLSYDEIGTHRKQTDNALQRARRKTRAYLEREPVA